MTLLQKENKGKRHNSFMLHANKNDSTYKIKVFSLK